MVMTPCPRVSGCIERVRKKECLGSVPTVKQTSNGAKPWDSSQQLEKHPDQQRAERGTAVAAVDGRVGDPEVTQSTPWSQGQAGGMYPGGGGAAQIISPPLPAIDIIVS